MSRPAAEPRRVVIPRRVDYFEVGVFAVSAMYGTVALVKYQEVAATAVRMYPGIGGVLFLAMLGIGGVTGLVSFGFKTIMGPKLELASLTLLVLLCIAYSLWTPFSVGMRGIGLLLFMGILIAVPGYFTSRRLSLYIRSLEAIENGQPTGGEESGTSDTSNAMDIRRSRRWRWR